MSQLVFPAGRPLAVELFEVARTSLYVAVSVPVYMLASLALAGALYVRIVGALLHLD